MNNWPEGMGSTSSPVLFFALKWYDKALKLFHLWSIKKSIKKLLGMAILRLSINGPRCIQSNSWSCRD